MKNVQIIYASITGNTEQLATLIQTEFENLGFNVALDECTQVDAATFLAADICLLGTYTYGDDGNIPDEMAYLYDDLADLDLTGKLFGVFGSGDSFYNKYCQSVDDFEALFVQTGATKGTDSLKLELFPEEKDLETIQTFVTTIVTCDQEREA